MTIAAVRRDIVARLGRAGAAAWLLAIVVMIGVELLAFAATPTPGEPANDLSYVSPIVGFLAPLLAIYIAARRMAGLRKPFRGGRPALRFTLFCIGWFGAFAIGRLILGAVLTLDYREVATHWAVLLGYFVMVWLATIRLVGIVPGLAIGEPTRHIRIMIRDSRGAAVALAAGFLIFVVPPAAIAIALEVLGARMLLDPAAALALAGVQGVAEAVQLVTLTAVGAAAWGLAEPALRRAALRT